MKTEGATLELARQSLLDIQRYLADEIAPMMTIEAVRELVRLPPRFGAAAVEQWLQAQLSAPDRAVTVSRYLYHAVKKFHVFSELKLVDPQLMDRYVGELARLVVQLCPEREQAELRLRLSRIGEVATTLSSAVSLLNREMGSQAEEERIRRAQQRHARRSPPPAATSSALPVSPRLDTLIGRLEELHGPETAGADEEESGEVLARLVGKAAIDARDTAQFDASLERVRKMGVEPRFDRVFRLLGKQIPGWEIDAAQDLPGPAGKMGRLLEAMHRIVSLAGSPEDGIQRFNEMLYAAIEQFNEGHLAQAVAMFDVAERLIEDKLVDAQAAEVVRTRARGAVSSASLRQFASAPAKHGLLRKVLDFFPDYRPQRLLELLDGEPKREVRRLLLSLIEIRGPECRSALLERLASYREGTAPDPQGFYSRNVVFLLRRIPHVAEDDQHQELKLLTEFSRPDRPFMVTKEAVAALALLSVPRAEKVLLERMAAFEDQALIRESLYDPEELLEILDRGCAALAAMGRPQAVRSLVDHALRREPELGHTIRRLRHLAACDLAQHPEQLERLLDVTRKMLPAKVMGMVLGRRVRDVSHLVQALSGTRDSRVRELLEETVERFSGQGFAEQAREALAALQAKSTPETEKGEELSGDLEVFGLPTMLQSIAESELTGRLLISESNSRQRAVFSFTGGQIARCEVGRLNGLDAVCQLFERPRPATFRFEKALPGDPITPGEGTMRVMQTILEATRRHDEFHEDRAAVPDGASLMPGDKECSLPKGELDKKFVDEVWHEAARGIAPETCEGIVNSDAYRVRRLYAHWVETGALKRRPTG